MADKPKRSPKDVPLDIPGEGTGLAENARRRLLNRSRSIDDAVEAAERGRIQRMRNGQSTDNSQ